jgi:hypothetical protein
MADSQISSQVKPQGLSILDLVTGEWIYFDNYISNKFNSDNNVAYEVLEQGAFSSDSKQNNPVVLNIIGTKSIPLKSSQNQQDVVSFKQIIADLASSDHLVDIYLNAKYQQYSNSYQSYTLKSFDFEQNPEQLHLVANLNFQQVRMTTVDFTSVTPQVAKPANSPVQQSGQVQPQAAQESILNQLVNGNYTKFLP